MIRLIDIHCHLDFPQFDGDRDDLIKNTLDSGMWMITVGADEKTSKNAVEIAEKHEGIFATVGVHPHDADKPWDDKLFKDWAKRPEVVAVGECGLDYFRIKNNELKIKNKQKNVFKRQIELAVEMGKPLMIHCREAHSDVLEILNSYFLIHNSKLHGNVHFFSGDWPTAQKYLELGFTFSFTGVITFTNQYDEVIKNLPMDKIMVETDAPFVAPVPYRGKRCEPLYTRYVAKRIAEIKRVFYEEVAKQTTQNAIKLFNLK